jgi:hypothetical protein
MDRTEGKTKETHLVTREMMKKELEEHYDEVARYLRFHGIYLTKDRMLPKIQILKAVQLLKKKYK